MGFEYTKYDLCAPTVAIIYVYLNLLMKDNLREFVN